MTQQSPLQIQSFEFRKPWNWHFCSIVRLNEIILDSLADREPEQYEYDKLKALVIEQQSNVGFALSSIDKLNAYKDALAHLNTILEKQND